MSVDLTGRRVLITGASSGIGAATCHAVVGCGGSVAMLARRRDRLDQLAEELGDRAVPVQADVTDLGTLAAGVTDAASALGGLDGVVAVAGQNIFGTVATGTPEVWRAIMDVNLIGPLATVRYAVDHFGGDGRRDIVLVGSSAGVVAMPNLGIYGVSKRGLQAAAESMRLEMAPVGVNVSLVIPGLFATEGTRGDKIHMDGERSSIEVPPLVPGTTGLLDPSPLADAIAFLLGLPEGVCINELVMRPTSQLFM